MVHFPSWNSNHPSVRTINGGRDKKNKTKRENAAMKLSTDPQSVAARERRHRIRHRFNILQSLLPGESSSKMDTVSMLDQAIHYVKFLKVQIWLHQAMIRRYIDDDPTNVFPPTNSLPTQPDLFSSILNVGSAQLHQVSQVAVPNCYIQGGETNPYDLPITY